MSKSIYVKFVGELLAKTDNVPTEVVHYFNTVVTAKKVNKKEVEKSNAIKSAILDFLKSNAGTGFTRETIGDTLHNSGNYPEEMFVNSKGTGVAYNSITAFANQLVADGLVEKYEVKVGKSKKVHYKA